MVVDRCLLCGRSLTNPSMRSPAVRCPSCARPARRAPRQPPRPPPVPWDQHVRQGHATDLAHWQAQQAAHRRAQAAEGARWALGLGTAMAAALVVLWWPGEVAGLVAGFVVLVLVATR